MSQAAQTLPRTSIEPHLGPAKVAEVTGGAVVVELADGRRVEATPALAQPYGFARHDEVLVVGREAHWYVIGVLRGRGVARLSADRIRIAAGGRLRLEAARELRLRGRSATLAAASLLSMEAKRAFREARRVEREVRERLDVATRDLDQTVRGRWTTRALRAAVKVRGLFRMNGSDVRLG